MFVAGRCRRECQGCQHVGESLKANIGCWYCLCNILFYISILYTVLRPVMGDARLDTPDLFKLPLRKLEYVFTM